MNLLDYNFISHYQLASYEAAVIGVISNDNTNDDEYVRDQGRDIFTFVYLKSHNIKVQVSGSQYNVSCISQIILPKNEEAINRKNYDSVEKYLSLDLKVVDNVDDVLKRTHKRHYHKHLKRSKRQLVTSEIRKIEKDPNVYDSSQFIVIQMINGPLTFNHYSNKIEEFEKVSCSLTLFDYDDTLAYANTIYETLKSTKKDTTNQKGVTTRRPFIRNCANYYLIQYKTLLLILFIHFLIFDQFEFLKSLSF
jgi:hypothetical protein